MDRSSSQNGRRYECFNILTGTPTGKRPLGRPSAMGECYTMDLKEIGINMRNWVDSAQDREYWRAGVNAH